MTDDIEGLVIEPEYEWLRSSIADLGSSPDSGTREVKWLDAGHLLGAARTVTGAVELFIAGNPIDSRHPTVKDLLEHSLWIAGVGETVPANRLVFPAAPYFDQVAAFVAAELLEAGLTVDRDGAFRATEPLIALAMRRATMGNSSLLGLAGELVFLRSLLWTAPIQDGSRLVESWKGAGRSTRDYQFGPVGVEVKTTTTASAKHHVQGVHQVELGTSVDGEPEHALYLLSLGVTWLGEHAETGYSIADLTQSALDRLPDGETRAALLDALRAYGADPRAGYDHNRDAKRPAFARRFTLKWARLYDVTDPNLSLLDSSMLESAKHVISASVAFDIELPEKVTGDVNPIVGLPEATARVLHANA